MISVEYIELGGEKRPILFGLAAFRLRKMRSGKSMTAFFAELQNHDEPDIIFNAVADLTFCALKTGDRCANISDRPDYDEMDVSIWIDQTPGSLELLSQLILNSLPKSAAGEGDDSPGEGNQTGILTS